MSILHRELVQIGKDLIHEVSLFGTRITDCTNIALDIEARQVDQRTDEAANTQIMIIQKSAHEVPNKELHSLEKGVVTQLEQPVRLTQPSQSPWPHWLTHCSAFVTGTALAQVVVVVIWF